MRSAIGSFGRITGIVRKGLPRVSAQLTCSGYDIRADYASRSVSWSVKTRYVSLTTEEVDAILCSASKARLTPGREPPPSLAGVIRSKEGNLGDLDCPSIVARMDHAVPLVEEGDREVGLAAGRPWQG